MANLKAAGARLGGASLLRADLTKAALTKADLREVDARMANFSGATLTEARLTGAKIFGLRGTGAPVSQIEAEWIDASTGGDGARRISNGEISSLLSGSTPADGRSPGAPGHRYFGKGDVLRNASLEFERGANVEIDSFFQNCSITLGEGTQLILGKEGVLADCKISGGGKIVIHGQFFERESPGIDGAREVIVSGRGALVASVKQAEELTRFGFERGSRLRVKIIKK
jgi:hypothetical protein